MLSFSFKQSISYPDPGAKLIKAGGSPTIHPSHNVPKGLPSVSHLPASLFDSYTLYTLVILSTTTITTLISLFLTVFSVSTHGFPWRNSAISPGEYPAS